MTATQAAETVRAQWIRCSPEDFGRFVDGLYELTAAARGDADSADLRFEREHIDYLRAVTASGESDFGSELEAAEGRLARQIEIARVRRLPEWTCSINRRQITVRGLWDDVQDQIPLTEAKDLRIAIGDSSNPPRFVLQVLNRGLDISVTASSGEWLDRHVPGIESGLRRIRPRWGWIPRRAINTAVLIAAVPFIALSVYQLLVAQPWLTTLMLCVMLPFWACIVITWIPAVRFGSPRRRWWMRGGQWLILAIVSGFIGAIIAKWIG